MCPPFHPVITNNAGNDFRCAMCATPVDVKQPLTREKEIAAPRLSDEPIETFRPHLAPIETMVMEGADVGAGMATIDLEVPAFLRRRSH
jgi:hypothetical protein